MNKLLLIPALLSLGACSQAELMGPSGLEYNTSNLPRNGVTADGRLVSPANCPNWTASPYSTAENAKQGNFGCATVTNLGLMLHDPRDLERGSSGGIVPPDPTRSADAIRNYKNALSSPSAAAQATADAINSLSPSE